MSANDRLGGIPVVEQHVPGATVLHPLRRYTQLATLALLVLIPVSGLFRIDPVEGGFVILDRQIWFSDVMIVMGFWIFVASLLVVMYSLVGAVFCGWICPQNTVSEWANRLTERLLGRRAKMMDVSGEKMKVAARRRSLLNYLLLGLALLGASMFYALIPLFYFYPPEAIWSFVTFQYDERLSDSLYWIYSVCVAVMLMNVAVIRHLLCKYMCIYRVWQHSFKTRDTLHVAYDSSRTDHCSNCHYCKDACFLDIDPRKTEIFDSCVNCGECIVACDTLHSKSKKLEGPGLLRFAFGDEHKEEDRSAIGSFFARAKVALSVTALGAAMFAAGLVGYEPASLSVGHGRINEQTGMMDYRINLAHKLYRPETMHIRITGLPDNAYRLDQSEVRFAGVGRKDVFLHLKPVLPPGLHRFKVIAESESGWSKTFNVVHYAGRREPQA